MSQGVEPEEIQAIVEAVQPKVDRQVAVALRDFDEPRRISAAQRARLERTLDRVLPGLGTDLQGLLRSPRKLTLGSITEVDSRGLFADRPAPFVIACFRCHGQPGWVAWESTAAAACSEIILSGVEPEGEADARRLTPAEARLVEDLLAHILGAVLEPLGAAAEDIRLTQHPQELLGEDEEEDERADTQRLLVHLQLDGPGGASELQLYLPGIVPEEGAETHTPLAAMPDHLGQVQVDVRALLGSVEVPLGDLLRLEVGDVIPLGVEAGGQLDLVVEEVPCALVRWGRHGERLSVQIERLVGRLAEEAR